MECPQCAKLNPDGARFCSHCGAALPQRQAGPQPAAQAAPAAPVATSGKAVASLVLGIGGLCCTISAILGIVFGILALGDIKRSGGRLEGQSLATAGIVVSVIMLVLSVMWTLWFLAWRMHLH